MKKVNLFVVFVALGVLAWMLPTHVAGAAAAGSVVISQQDTPAEPNAQDENQNTQTFTGQIMQHDGKYVLHDAANKEYQLDDQEKAKQFDGKNVKVSGTLDEESMVIHVTSIEEAEG